MRVRNRAEKIKFDRFSGSSLMPLLPLLLCVNRTLGTISGDCRAALAMTGKAVYGAGAGLVVDKLAILSLRGTKGRSNLFVKRANLNIHYSLWPFSGFSLLL